MFKHPIKTLTYLSFFLLIVTNSCKQNIKYKEAGAKFSKESVSLDTSYVEIGIDSNTRLFEYKYSSSIRSGLFLGYNPKQHSLDFFDLTNKKQLMQSKLPLRGPNKVEGVTGCFLINADSVLLLTKKNIILVDELGRTLNSIKINSFSEEDFFKNNYIIEQERARNFLFDKDKKRILVSTLDARGMDRKQAYYSMPISEISLKDKVSYKNIPIPWSNLYKTNFYGFLSSVFMSLVDGNMIVSFPIEPNVYVFNEKTGKIKVFGSYPGFKGVSSPLAQPLSTDFRFNDDKKLEHFVENINYEKVVFSSSDKMYFRVITLGLDGKYRGIENYEKKKSFLVAYNKDFEITKVLDLNDHNYVKDGAFNTDLGLMIPCPKGVDNLRFKVFKFNQK